MVVRGVSGAKQHKLLDSPETSLLNLLNFLKDVLLYSKYLPILE